MQTWHLVNELLASGLILAGFAAIVLGFRCRACKPASAPSREKGQP